MSDSPAVTITLRIPGVWGHPGELVEALPEGIQLTPEKLTLPGGEEFEMIPMPPDDQFARVFTSACRQPPSREEQDKVNRYSVNIGLKGPGGSLEQAAKLMQAGAAIVRAGGAGVFIDNCGLAHGGSLWLEMTDDAGTDAISYAFVSVYAGQDEAYTMGMHIMGFPDLLIRESDQEAAGETLIETVRYICGEEKPVAAGHILMDESGPRFQCLEAPAPELTRGSPMHNPFGRLRLVSVQEIAEGN